MDYEMLNTPSIDSDYIPPTVTPSVPPDYLIQSGGGLSNMHHGHPQGPYSVSASRSDIYGYSEPFQQTGFMQAVRGNMYDGTGLDKTTPRTCDNLGLNQLPPYATMPGANIDYPHGQQIVWGTDDSKKNEEFTTDINAGTNYEMIEPFTDEYDGNVEQKTNPIILFVFVFLIFLVIDLWIQSSNSIIKKFIYRSGNPSIKQLLIVSSITTVILVLVSTWIKLPLVQFTNPEKYRLG